MQQLDRRKVADIAQMLLRWSDGDPDQFGLGCQPSGGGASDAGLLASVKAEQVRRSNRHKLLGVGRDLFSDPAWDLLLELYVARLGRKRLSSSAIGLDAGIAQSTALRWLTYLVSLGLVERTQDPADKRRQWVALSERAAEGMRRCFS